MIRALTLLLAAGTASAEPPLAAELAGQRARLQREGRRPEAAVALLGLHDYRGWLDPGAVRAVAEVGARSRNPLVRSVAERELLRLDLARGDAQSALQRRRQLGFIEGWQIIGPVGGADSLETSQPIESTPFDLAAPLQGKARKVAWRPVPDVITAGYVPLDAMLRPNQDVCAYAVTAVFSKKRRRAAVRSGSGGPLRIWVGDDLVLDRREYRPPEPDQDAAPIRLDAGWNRVLLKTCARSGSWGFYLRITDPRGQALALRASDDAKEIQGAEGGGKAGHAVRTLRVALEARTERARDDGPWRDLASFHRHVAADDPASKQAERAQRKAIELRPTADSYIALASMLADLDERRRALAEAVRLEPTNARALTDLGRVLVLLDRERRADELLDRALAAAPDHLPAVLQKAAAQRTAGFPTAAADRLRAFATDYGRPGRLLSALTEAEQQAGRITEAIAVRERYLKQAADDVSAWRDLVDLRRETGDLEGALQACDRLIAARPELSSGYRQKATLLIAGGRLDEGIAELRAALAIAPQDARLHEELGRLLHKAGRTEQAAKALERSSQLDPHNPDLRAYLAHLQPRSASPLDRFRREPADVLSAAKSASLPQDAPAVVLWDLHAIEVHPGGQSRTLHQRFVAIRDDRGAQGHAEFSISYTPSRQEVEVRAARLWRDGRIVASADRYEHDLSEPWYGLYYDYRGLTLRLEDVRPADIVEIEYLVEDATEHNLLGDTFGDFVFLQELIPRLEAEAVVMYPASRPLHFNELSAPWLSLEEEEAADGLVARRVVMRDVPEVEDEPGMPGFSEVAKYLHVSTFEKWSEVADWYANLVRDQLRSDASIERAVRKAVRGISGERDRIGAVHNLVVKQTRYVGLEFGIHGYQPYRTTDVYSRKFGDCKDKAALLLVMMRLIGVEAQMVLVRTRRGGDIADMPASLAVFDHAIVYLPKYDLYLDGTAEFSGTEELPAQDQGVPVLHIAPGETLRRTPIFPPEASRVQVVLTGGLDDAGGATLSEELTLRGQAAAQWRRHYQSPAQRHDRYEQAWNERHSGTKLVDVAMPGVEDLESPVRVEARVKVPRLGRKEGRKISVPVAAREAELVRTYARQSTRRHDLILDYPWMQEAIVDLAPPPGMSVGPLPQPQRIDGRFGQFELSVRREGSRVLTHVRLRIADRRVPATGYPEFRRFLLQIDEALGQTITFVGDE